MATETSTQPPTASSQYLGQLRCEVHHSLSGEVVVTDAPPDNNGLGRSFSPTDLVAVGLLTCMQTTVGIQVRNQRLPDVQLQGTVQKIMADDPRRIAALEIELHVESEAPLTPEEINLLESTAMNCPVAKTLQEVVRQEVKFFYKPPYNG